LLQEGVGLGADQREFQEQLGNRRSQTGGSRREWQWRTDACEYVGMARLASDLTSTVCRGNSNVFMGLIGSCLKGMPGGMGLSNPGLMNMAAQLMSDPNMQNM